MRGMGERGAAAWGRVGGEEGTGGGECARDEGRGESAAAP